MHLGYVIHYVPDVESTVAFYEKAFGLTRRFVHESGFYAEMETGETALAFAAETMLTDSFSFKTHRKTAEPAGTEIGLVTENVKKAFKKAVAAGATPLVEPLEKPWGQTVSYVRDLNGCLVEICSPIQN